MKGMKLPDPRESALLTGETGSLLVAWRLAGDDTFADELLERVRVNIDNPAEEVMWGSPDTLIAARAMLEWTGDERWREAWNESAEALLARRGTAACGFRASADRGRGRPPPRPGSSATSRRCCPSSRLSRGRRRGAARI